MRARRHLHVTRMNSLRAIRLSAASPSRRMESDYAPQPRWWIIFVIAVCIALGDIALYLAKYPPHPLRLAGSVLLLAAINCRPSTAANLYFRRAFPMISCVRGLVLAWIAAGVLLLLYVLQRRQVALVCRGRSTDSIRRPRSAALSRLYLFLQKCPASYFL
jgi:hypothetical protein